MKKVIFSMYLDLPNDTLIEDAPLEGDTISKKIKGANNFRIHKNRLIAAHKEYAKKINCDYVLYDSMDDYINFEKTILNLIPDGLPWDRFDLMNFFKLSLLNQLAETYDEIVYIDLDLIPNTEESIFDILDLQNNKFVSFNYDKFIGENETWKTLKEKYKDQNIYTHPVIKREGTNRILNLPDNKDIYYTFIIGITKEQTQKLNINMMNDLPFLFGELKKLHEEDSWFAVDNETYLIYKILKENIKIHHVPYESNIHFVWSKKDITQTIKDFKFIHVVSKDFNEVLNEIVA